MILYIILFLLVCKYILTLNTERRSENKDPESSVKILTYNIQRLPWLQIPNIDVQLLLEHADIVCLQEDFSIGLQSVKNVHGYKPGARLWKAVASGLSVYSKVRWESARFEAFYNCSWTDGDALADKGFIEIEYESFVLYNTHLQSGSEKDVGAVRKAQLEQLLQSAQKWKKPVCIVGDLNQDVKSIQIPGWQAHTSVEPTFDAKLAEPRDWLDGMLCRQVNVIDKARQKFDAHADHFAVQFHLHIH
jgi:exonuclease III